MCAVGSQVNGGSCLVVFGRDTRGFWVLAELCFWTRVLATCKHSIWEHGLSVLQEQRQQPQHLSPQGPGWPSLAHSSFSKKQVGLQKCLWKLVSTITQRLRFLKISARLTAWAVYLGCTVKSFVGHLRPNRSGHILD